MKKMKMYFIGVLLLISIAFVGAVSNKTAANVEPLPVATTVGLFDKITSAGTTEVEVQLSNLPSSPAKLIYIHVDAANSGTIQFSVGEAIVAGHNAWPAGSKVPVTIYNGVANLRYKASAASQSFVITY